MKSFTFIHILLFLICMLIYKCTSAQDYVVTTSGDTIRGEVKLLSFGTDQKVQVKKDDGKEVYSIIKTQTVWMDNELYHPIKGPSGHYEYMKPIRLGYLSLYAFQNGSRFDGMFLVKADGNSLELPNLAFKKFMTNFLQECESVTTRIDQGELQKKDIEQITDEFNACIQKNTRSDLVRKDTPVPIAPDAWNTLEGKVNQSPDFEGKSTALEMIADIKKRTAKKEKVPNFVVDGLKSILSGQPNLIEPLEKALAELD